MITADLLPLIHLTGFLTGIGLFGLLAAMTWPGRWRAGGRRSNRILGLAAAVGFAWNLGALFVFGSRDFGLGQPRPWLTELWSVGFLCLTVGYGALLLGLVFTSRGRTSGQRAMIGVALAAFALSAFHLSHHPARPDSWIAELLLHHASLPLVLVILYQDYRFALADLFLKRALAALALVALAVAEYEAVVRASDATGAASALPVLLIGAWIATALVYPSIRRAADRFVDGYVLRRGDYRERRSELGRLLAAAHEPAAMLDVTCAMLADACDAARGDWECTGDARVRGVERVVLVDGAGARVAIPTSAAPGYAIQLGHLASGRRLLSDDLALMEFAASLLARRLDEVHLAAERHDRDVRESELRRLSAEAELRALRAQINPHFLFNALTTIAYLVQSAPTRAVDTLYQLTSLLRAVLRPESGELVSLGDEMQIVDAYLAIEQARFEHRLHVERDVAEDALGVLIPPLVIQPLVENAIKHGVARSRAGGVVSIRAHGDAGMLRISVGNSPPGAARHSFVTRGAGIGLANVERRLQLFFGSDAGLRVARTDAETTVELSIPIGLGQARWLTAGAARSGA